VNAGRLPLFCDTALAGRIERAEAQLISRASKAARGRSGTAGFVMPLAGGVASFAEEGSPFNKIAGLGFGGVPGAAALGETERAFAVCGAPVQIELAHLADPAIGALLTMRGYRLTSFENVLGRAIDGRPAPVTPPGVEVRRSGDAKFEAWLEAVADAVAQPDTQGVPAHEEFPREVIKAAERDFAVAGVLRYAALRDGVIAAAPASTWPRASRSSPARRPFPRTAVVTTQPGSKSQQNAQRQGFDLLYTRAILVKQP
jgi:hypothetical protein